MLPTIDGKPRTQWYNKRAYNARDLQRQYLVEPVKFSETRSDQTKIYSRRILSTTAIGRPCFSITPVSPTGPCLRRIFYTRVGFMTVRIMETYFGISSEFDAAASGERKGPRGRKGGSICLPSPTLYPFKPIAATPSKKCSTKSCIA